MSRLFYHVCQDNAGNLLFGVSGTMRIAGSGTLATIYGDEGLTVILPNPMTNHPSFASFKCFLGAGDYDFYLTKSGYSFETLTGVQGHGTMAQQDANAVAITGGAATFTGDVTAQTHITPDRAGSPAQATSFGIAAGAGRFNLYAPGTAVNYLAGFLGVGGVPVTNVALQVAHPKTTTYGIQITPTGSDLAAPAIRFMNVGLGEVGTITTSGTVTAYNTTSDARLKHDVEDLTGELALIQALRPVSFRWLADDSPGVGFLAQEVAALVQGVITGEEGAVDEAGAIKPQMIDYAKLVPYLVGAIRTLTARLVVLEDALGV